MSEQTYRNPLFGQRVDRYIPPELRQGLGAVLALGDMLNPVSAYREYIKSAREGDVTGAATNLAGFVAPGAAGAIASRLGRVGIRGVEPYSDDAARALMEMLSPTGAPDDFGVAPRMVGGVEDFGRGLGSVRMPSAEASQRTQIAGTFPTYEKAVRVFDEVAPDGRSLDYGAGLGKSSELGFDTFEPFAREGFDPTYRVSSDIPDASYERVTNLNVLNVLDPETRRGVVLDIGRVLKPDGVAVITTRGRDVLTSKGERGPEDMSVITTAGTYQKGFTKPELVSYLRDTLGDGFEVKSLNLGPAGALVRKLPSAEASPGGVIIRPDDLFRGEGTPRITVRQTDQPFVVRGTQQDQIDDMIQSGLVRPKEGGYGKEKKSSMYFGESPEALPTGGLTRPSESRYVLVGDSDKLAGTEGPIPIDRLRHVWVVRNGETVDVLPEILRANRDFGGAQYRPD